MLKSIAPCAFAVLALTSIQVSVGQADAPPPGMDSVSACSLSGGEIIAQPAGSTIEACCSADGCIICDSDGSSCDFDPAYNLRNGGRQQHQQSGEVVAPQSPSGNGNAPASTLQAVPLLQLNQ